MRSTFTYAIIATLVGLVVADEAGACNRRGRRCGDCCQPCMSRCQPACNHGCQPQCSTTVDSHPQHMRGWPFDPITCKCEGANSSCSLDCKSGACYHVNINGWCMCGCSGAPRTPTYAVLRSDQLRLTVNNDTTVAGSELTYNKLNTLFNLVSSHGAPQTFFDNHGTEVVTLDDSSGRPMLNFSIPELPTDPAVRIADIISKLRIR